MRVAALYDVHGNLPALEAVIEATIEAASRILPDVRGLHYWLRDTPTYEQRIASLVGG